MPKWSIVIALVALASCKPRETPTLAGTTLFDWNNKMTKLSTGVALGAPVGAPVHETRLLEFTPNGEVRDKSLGVVRIELTIDREDVALTPNAAGARPGETAALPTHATAKLLDAGGWKVLDAKCGALNGPADIGERERRVGFSTFCPIDMRGGREDIANVTVTIMGNGAHTASAAFGIATIH